MKSETQIARQLYLFGAGDGKRVLSVKALCAATGLSVDTIGRHMPAWRKESEELLSGASDCGLALHLSKENSILFESTMTALSVEIKKVMFELKTHEKITAKLEDWLDKFDEDDKDNALRILEAWQRNCGQISNLRSQFLALQKQFAALSGVVDLKDIQVTREKTLATGRAKLDLKREENQAGVRDLTAPVSGVFARRQITETEPE